MILSHEHRFIFVKGMKVAGTSVEMALSTICGPEDIITPIAPVDEKARLKMGGRCQNYSSDPEEERAYCTRVSNADLTQIPSIPRPQHQFYNHMPLHEIVSRCNRCVETYPVVAVERSPYSKVLSWMNMRISFSKYRRGQSMVASMSEITAGLTTAIESRAVLAVRNIDRYRGRDGKLHARLLRYDRLEEDFKSLVRDLCPKCEYLPLPHAKKGLLADTFDPRKIFTPTQIASINELFEEEFTTFGYEMIQRTDA